MPTRTRYQSLPGEMAHGLLLLALAWLVHRLFGKELAALIEAVADRADRATHIHADIPPIAVTFAYPEVPQLDPADPRLVPGPDLDTLIEGTPEWYRALAHNGDGSPAYQPIDPTDGDWPDPDPFAGENRTALIEPGTDLLAQIRATPNPSGVPLPGLHGETVE